MSRPAKTECIAFGVRALNARHYEVRRLKRLHAPSRFGFRVWKSSWLLMDFFSRCGLRDGARVMEIGCGWGLAGIYCAKKHHAVVTGVDIDPEVFPYLRLHARINDVKIATVNRAFEELTAGQLGDIDVLIGADICFWDALVDPFKDLIVRALGQGVKTVVIADPGRVSFHDLADHFIDTRQGEILSWEVHKPSDIDGKILRVVPLSGESPP